MLFLKATTGLAYDITIGKKFTFFNFLMTHPHLPKLNKSGFFISQQLEKV
jgi:hypothetical protein